LASTPTVPPPILPSPISPHEGTTAPDPYPAHDDLLACSHRVRPPSLAHLYAHLTSFWTVELCTTRRPFILSYFVVGPICCDTSTGINARGWHNSITSWCSLLALVIPTHSIISALYCQNRAVQRDNSSARQHRMFMPIRYLVCSSLSPRTTCGPEPGLAWDFPTVSVIYKPRQSRNTHEIESWTWKRAVRS